MRRSYLLFSAIAFCYALNLRAQDTFSMVAVDSVTGEVGSVGASCVDLTIISGISDDFLGELFPGEGAINTQAWYTPLNQSNARDRFNAGDTPSEILQWVLANDETGNPEMRQYGVVRLVNGSPQSAAHTGTGTDDYKNHIVGPGYSIQGNILSGQAVLDSMEARFMREEGDLTCKLMAALQGANMVGADSRCASNGTSSLFAFIKVAQPTDSFGNPSFLLSVKTTNGEMIEPIDSLQKLFDTQQLACTTVGQEEVRRELKFDVFPNPAQTQITVRKAQVGEELLQIWNVSGELLLNQPMEQESLVDITTWPTGVYVIRIGDTTRRFMKL